MLRSSCGKMASKLEQSYSSQQTVLVSVYEHQTVSTGIAPGDVGL